MKRFNNVAVLMGGPSSEREVSLRSGKAVAKGLREAGYEVAEIDVADRNLDMPAGIEAVFVALHGEFGEDGEVQALLEQKCVPYTGSGPAASKAAFDKKVSKQIFVDNNIPTPEYELLQRGQARSLPLPVVVKPTSQGSSIGVHRVFAESEWEGALSDALKYGPEALVESYIKGKELTVGIVEDEVLPVIEIAAPDDWYNYDAKYTRGATNYIVPAPVSEDTYRACQAAALRTFQSLACRGFARVDCRVSEDGAPYVLELNSIPGFTETSLLPKAAAHAGMSFPALCDRIMSIAACDP
jgi:D-alanine-D-alanine ligase